MANPPAAGEFELIARYLSHLGAERNDVLLGVGDDAAVVRAPPGHDLALAHDTLVDGVHFPHGLPGDQVGHRALAVNLSDLAAMGARPAWALLSLTLPCGDAEWVRVFASGLDGLARKVGLAVVGGDTTSGPLTVGLSVVGWLPTGQSLRRSGARAGDELWVSGWPGEAAAGLACIQSGVASQSVPLAELVERFRWPQPRLELGAALLGRASACIDLSDGLAADVGKLCQASGVAADLDGRSLPVSAALRAGAADDRQLRRWLLAGGDDYELAFTLPAGTDPAPLRAAAGCAIHRIGRIVEGAGVRLDGEPVDPASLRGYDHFLADPGRGA
ncbi:MAG: thiamine-phosphate kinase [Steroidobacteraceae bacterium]